MKPVPGQIIEYEGMKCLILNADKSHFEVLRQDSRTMQLASWQYESCKLIGTTSVDKLLVSVFGDTKRNKAFECTGNNCPKGKTTCCYFCYELCERRCDDSGEKEEREKCRAFAERTPVEV